MDHLAEPMQPSMPVVVMLMRMLTMSLVVWLVVTPEAHLGGSDLVMLATRASSLWLGPSVSMFTGCGEHLLETERNESLQPAQRPSRSALTCLCTRGVFEGDGGYGANVEALFGSDHVNGNCANFDGLAGNGEDGETDGNDHIFRVMDVCERLETLKSEVERERLCRCAIGGADLGRGDDGGRGSIEAGREDGLVVDGEAGGERGVELDVLKGAISQWESWVTGFRWETYDFILNIVLPRRSLDSCKGAAWAFEFD